MRIVNTILASLLFTIVMSFQSQAQRYFEFHYPDNVTTCRGCEGLGEEENFIVKVQDNNTEFIERALSDLEKLDSLKQHFVLGFVQYAQDDFNYEWSWEFRNDTVIYMNKDGLYADSFGGISSKIEKNLDGIIDQLGGKCFISKARVLREIMPTSIVLNSNTISFNVFPNPMIDKVIVDFTDLSDIQYIEIRQLDGKLVKEYRQLESNKIELFRDDFNSAGTYFINASTIHGIFTKKLIITK